MLTAGETYIWEVSVHFGQHRLGENVGPFEGQFQARRGSDEFWWDGTTFQAAELWVDAPAFGGTDDPHCEATFTVPADAEDAEVFNFRVRTNFDPATDLTWVGQVGSSGGSMPAHQHIGAFPEDLPIGDRS